jgi:hypothetical protein
MKVVSEIFVTPRNDKTQTLDALKKNGLTENRPSADKIIAVLELNTLPEVYKKVEQIKTLNQVKDASIFSIQYYP